MAVSEKVNKNGIGRLCDALRHWLTAPCVDGGPLPIAPMTPDTPTDDELATAMEWLTDGGVYTVLGENFLRYHWPIFDWPPAVIATLRKLGAVE